MKASRIFFTSLAVGAALLASAQAGQVTDIITGRGQAISPTQSKAAFAIRGIKNSNNQVRAEFKFQAINAAQDTRVSIDLVEGNRLEVNGNSGGFAGPAKFTVKTQNGVRTFRGTVAVKVQTNGNRRGPSDQAAPSKDNTQIDMKSPLDLPTLDFTPTDANGPNTDRRRPDTISVEFKSPQLDKDFKFEGRVVRGNISVREAN